MAMTLQELEKIHGLLLHRRILVDAEEALKIIRREIDRMKQDELLSASGANPT